ncbi:MAG: hypothetical protein LRZ85_04345 [Alphaproteobacteria bacterium]|nr:hypothetical protein [Alphaproteobacteria bacterium]MCD8520097.1 hypothetical protein [Alphaproteobacteria bacterium]MCD8525874.1 hypothetical protein [Alphaproteobacteria bacterium]MCD8570734.1 hypothetical protein [Alphaproteobacteria bacterium]
MNAKSYVSLFAAGAAAMATAGCSSQSFQCTVGDRTAVVSYDFPGLILTFREGSEDAPKRAGAYRYSTRRYNIEDIAQKAQKFCDEGIVPSRN